MRLDEYLVAAAIVVILAVATVFGYFKVATSAACLRAGYPQGKVTYMLDRYCVRRVDQTDVVVPLSEASP